MGFKGSRSYGNARDAMMSGYRKCRENSDMEHSVRTSIESCMVSLQRCQAVGSGAASRVGEMPDVI